MEMPDYTTLRGLGYRLFAPIITPALHWLVEASEQDELSTLLFIGREGYFLKQLAEHTRSELGMAPSTSYNYLNASRGFLFKLLIDNPDFAYLTLQHHYKGTLHSFFMNRFFLSEEDAQIFSGRSRFIDIELPRDQEQVLSIIRTKASLLTPKIEPKRERYLEYIRQLVRGAPLAFVDVGFSGTIQKALGVLMGQDTRGYYFFLSDGFSSNVPSGMHTAQAYWRDDARFGDGDPLIDYSLILETLLTAPWGTLRDIKTTRRETFVYDDRVPLLPAFHALEAIVSGVRQHISDFVASGLSREDWSNVLDVRRNFELTLRFDQTEEMSYIRRLFEVDDTISGFGSVSPFKFLPGL